MHGCVGGEGGGGRKEREGGGESVEDAPRTVKHPAGQPAAVLRHDHGSFAAFAYASEGCQTCMA